MIRRLLAYLYWNMGNGIQGWKPVNSIPINQAIYCADCGNVTVTQNGCAVCGSHSTCSVAPTTPFQVTGVKLIKEELKWL